MISFLKKNLPEIILTICILTYSIYFSLFTINRYEKLYAHYFDLGIMHQTVYNTYKGIQTGDFSRILELTNPHTTGDQVKRMAIHNDMILALLAPFYFIHNGPETLLIIQSVTLAMGAVFIFLLGKKILHTIPYAPWISLVFSISYLLYPPMQKANIFEFHGVTLATFFILAMFYYWLEKNYKTSFIYFVLSLLTKEQVGMTTAFFGLYILYEEYKHHHVKISQLFNIKQLTRTYLSAYKKNVNTRFATVLIAVSIFWILISMLFIIPVSRGGEHFASKYYDHIKEQPWRVFTYPFKPHTFTYAYELLGPVGFLPILSPAQFLITLPELGINLLSNNNNMRNTYFHYDSLITPFVYISSIYGILFAFQLVSKKKKLKAKSFSLMVIGYVGLMAIIFSYMHSKLPFAKEADTYPWRPPTEKYYEVIAWKKLLDEDQLKVSTTGTIAPHFTSRQYFYDFSWKYKYADYVVVETHDARYGFLREKSEPAYKDLLNDKKYIRIYSENGIEVFRSVNSY